MFRSLPKLLAVLAIVLVVLLILVTTRHKSAPQTTGSPAVAAFSSTDTASVDNDSETLKQLIAEGKLKSKQYDVKFTQLEKENERYRALLNQKIAQGQLAVTNPHGTLVSPDALASTQAELEQMKSQLKQLQISSNPAGQSASTTQGAYPVGSNNGLTGLSSEQGMTTVVLDEPTPTNANGQSQFYPANASEGTLHPTTLPALSEPHEAQAETKVVTKIPFYTIPALSNLANTVLMTSLIGEVPQGNAFEQPPFPFLALVGKHDLLAANGIHLPPNISGMKISGYSVGVGSFVQGLSCTRSYITKVLFVFDDGHFVVYGKDPSGDNVDPSETLGYLSDPYGNPCMQGKYYTNAAHVLTMLTGMSMVQGAGEGLQQAQTTTLNGFEGSSTVFNGSVGKYALGSGASTSMDKASTYMLDRLKGTFDVVYIPASSHGRPTAVVANFTRTIPIDYNLQGRQIRYEQYGQVYAKNNRHASLD